MQHVFLLQPVTRSARRPRHLALGIQTGVGNHQFVDDPATDNCLVDDAGSVLATDATIPDFLGIDYDGRAVLTLIEATGAVGSNQARDSAFLQCRLKGASQRLVIVGIAAATIVPWLTRIATDEDVMSIWRHEVWMR